MSRVLAIAVCLAMASNAAAESPAFSRVPDDAVGVVHVRVKALLAAPGTRAMKKMIARPELRSGINQLLGGKLTLPDIDEATFVPMMDGFITVVRAVKPRKPESGAVAIDDRTWMLGPAPVLANLPRKTPETRSLYTAAYKEAERSHLVVVASESGLLSKLKTEIFSDSPKMAALKGFSLAAQLQAKELTVRAQFQFADEAAATAAEAELKQLLVAAPQMMQGPLAEVKAQKPVQGEARYHEELVKVMEALTAAFPTATTTRQNATLSVTLPIKTNEAGMALLVLMPKKKK